MTWIRNNAGNFVHSGASRTLAVGADQTPAEFEYVLEVAKPEHNIEALIRSNLGGDTCISIKVDATNVVVRVMFLNGAVSTTSTTAHGLAAGQPFLLVVRQQGQKVSVFVDANQTTAVTTFTSDTYLDQRYIGIGSDVPGARVNRIRLCELIPSISAPAEVLVIVAGGTVYASFDGGELALVAQGVVSSTAQVSITEYEGKAYLVDGRVVRIYDPGTQTVSKYTPTAGTLPGATVDRETSARQVLTAWGSLVFFDIEGDEINAYVSAIGDPLDLDVTSVEVGAAFAFNNSPRGRIGKPIIGAIASDRNTVVFGCVGAFWVVRGDPRFGGSIDPASSDHGLAGRWAMCTGGVGADSTDAGGDAVVLTPEGLGVIVGDRLLQYSRSHLTDVVQLGADYPLYAPIVVRDTQAHRIWVYLTAAGGSHDRHLCYDLRTGGPFPCRFSEDFGPTAACRYQGELLLGTRDGYVVRFSDAAGYDYPSVETTIESYVALSPINEGGDADDTELLEMVTVMARDSATVRWEYVGGLTIEDAYAGIVRAAGTAPAGRKNHLKRVRDTWIVVRLTDTSIERWAFESATVLVNAVPGQIGRTRIIGPTVVLPACGSGTGSSGSGTGSGSGSGSGSGPFSSGSGSGTGSDDEPGSGSGSGTGTGSGSGPGGSGSGTNTGNPIGPNPIYIPIGYGGICGTGTVLGQTTDSGDVQAPMPPSGTDDDSSESGDQPGGIQTGTFPAQVAPTSPPPPPPCGGGTVFTGA